MPKCDTTGRLRATGLDFKLESAYINAQREGCGVLDLSNRDKPGLDEKRAILLEFVAAFSILSVIALVLYLVLSYRPV